MRVLCCLKHVNIKFTYPYTAYSEYICYPAELGNVWNPLKSRMFWFIICALFRFDQHLKATSSVTNVKFLGGNYVMCAGSCLFNVAASTVWIIYIPIVKLTSYNLRFFAQSPPCFNCKLCNDCLLYNFQVMNVDYFPIQADIAHSNGISVFSFSWKTKWKFRYECFGRIFCLHLHGTRVIRG
jgi:hypothetical protein